MFLNYLATIKPLVWNELQKYLVAREPAEHYNIVRDYPERRGKYFRPGLVLLAADLFGAKQCDALLTAAAMQASEDWLLIHDDIEDHSLMRRGAPTLNEKHGDELALNAGDALHVIMWKILGDAARALDSERCWKLYNKMSDILLTTTEGQFLELNWERNNKFDLTENEYLEMIHRKAGYYTVIGPLQLGAIVANQNDAILQSIHTWGLPFGCAFQIWDDCLNLTAALSTQGKEEAGDLYEGKRTLILIHLLQNTSQAEKEKIFALYGKKRAGKTAEEIAWLLNLTRERGSIAYAQQRAQDLSKEALEKFNLFTAQMPPSQAQEIICSAIRFVATREK